MATYVFDCECYIDFFMVAFRDVDTGMTWYAEMYPGHPFPLTALPPGTLVSFNGINYDIPILSLALAGADNATLKKVSDDIIIGGIKPWQVMQGVDLSSVNHIDLIEVAPGKASLKTYGGRLHSKRLQDLPIEPSANISPSDRKLLIEYCKNDLQTTIDLYNKLKPQIDLRIEMSSEFGIDLRSKSDAQIAEAVIKSEVEKRLSRRVYRPDIHPAYHFKYKIPRWVNFKSSGMKKLLELISNVEFSISSEGGVDMPPILDSMVLRIGNGLYRMGIGGLHSSETCISHVSNDSLRILDRDVTSYYPSIILNEGLYPPHLGSDFLEVYRNLVERRIEAKRSGNKVMADALKICINGSFGKLGNKWSVLYSPDLLIQVTLTGQLALLMLIERVELCGFEVISANTDGVVIKCPVGAEGVLSTIVSDWESDTGFFTEETEYDALYSRDVNNYIAIKKDGSAKLKGAYSYAGIQKNATNEVCVDAAILFLKTGILVEEYIPYCFSNVSKFVTIRNVTGGAKYDGVYLGKSVRWYYAKNETRHIEYANNGNMVPRSTGARPLMELPEELPSDIDYDWYINESKSILRDVGYKGAL